MTTLRPNWRTTYGPIDLPMPDDGERAKMTVPGPHEDAEDCINADGSHGPDNPGAGALSGIAFGHSVQEPENVILLDEAVLKRTVPYDWEHHIRGLRYAIARTEMVRDTQGPRHVLLHAMRAKAYWDVRHADGSPVIYDGPGWLPDNINQYKHMAQLNQHSCIPVNGRALGWVMYGEAMAIKCDPHRDLTFARTCLDACALAANRETGQVCSGPNTGGDATVPVNVAYCFHMGILVHGALALAHQCRRPVPEWCVNWMLSVHALPVMDYYGVPSMPAFLYSDGGDLKAATGPGQHGDPEFGWWSSNCATLYTLTGQRTWRERIPQFGPQEVVSEETRKFTMLARGLA